MAANVTNGSLRQQEESQLAYHLYSKLLLLFTNKTQKKKIIKKTCQIVYTDGRGCGFTTHSPRVFSNYTKIQTKEHIRNYQTKQVKKRKRKWLTIVTWCISNGSSHWTPISGRTLKHFILVERFLVVCVPGWWRTNRWLVSHPIDGLFGSGRCPWRRPRIHVLSFPLVQFHLFLDVLEDDRTEARVQLRQLWLFFTQFPNAPK